MTNLIAEFKGKITSVDGVPYVRIPALTPAHIVQGDRAECTASGIEARAQLIGLTDTFRLVDSPRLTHLSGDFIGTFRIDLGTRAGVRAAREAKQAIVSPWYALDRDARPYGLLEMEERAHAAALAALAAHDAA